MIDTLVEIDKKLMIFLNKTISNSIFDILMPIITNQNFLAIIGVILIIYLGYFGEKKGLFIHNPGHTSGAITYIFGKSAFTGDTMFASGCGRIFEGTYAEMYDSINYQIGGLAKDTKIYFGHEYTEKNLNFANSIEPGNLEIQKKLKKVINLLSKGFFTTPTSLKEEIKTNPFLRCNSTEICQNIKSKDPKNDLSEKEVFKTLRELKDYF